MSTIQPTRTAASTLDLAGLFAFVRVAELGSFVRAAESLGLSKAAVSKQVSALERRLGAQLLHRTTRRLSLTEAGQAYLLHAQSALAEARAAENSVADTQTVPQGRLRVTVPMTFGLLHVSPWMSDFLREYPQIDLDLQLDDRARDLVLEGYDLAIRFGTQLRDSSLVARRLCDVRVLLCAAPDYLARHGRPSQPDQLNSYDCLHYSYNPSGRAWQFTRGDDTVRVALPMRMEANSSLALRAVMLAGGGLARVPEFVVADDIAAGRLEVVLPDWRLPALSLHAVMPERRYVPAKVRAFVDYLSARWGDAPDWLVETAHRSR